MVAPHEFNEDARWTLVESNKTHKQSKKERLQHVAQFLPLLTVKEGSGAMSNEPASFKQKPIKINLNKIFNGEKLANKIPKFITFKNNSKRNKDNNIKDDAKQDNDENISISSKTENINDNTSISESTSEYSRGSSITVETISENQKKKTLQDQVFIAKIILTKESEKEHTMQGALCT